MSTRLHNWPDANEQVFINYYSYWNNINKTNQNPQFLSAASITDDITLYIPIVQFRTSKYFWPEASFNIACSRLTLNSNNNVNWLKLAKNVAQLRLLWMFGTKHSYSLLVGVSNTHPLNLNDWWRLLVLRLWTWTAWARLRSTMQMNEHLSLWGVCEWVCACACEWVKGGQEGDFCIVVYLCGRGVGSSIVVHS